MAYIGSSAGAGFFPAEVIESESRSHTIACEALPYPTFQGSEAYMTQRGANIAAFASDPVREYAAARFIAWFTEPEQNVRFAVSTGYLPVKTEALKLLPEVPGQVSANGNEDAVKKSLQVSIEAMNEKKFYIRRPFSMSYERNQIFDSSLENCTRSALEEMDRRIQAGEEKQQLQREYTDQEHFENWYDTLVKKMAGIKDE